MKLPSIYANILILFALGITMGKLYNTIKWISILLFVALTIVLLYESCLPAKVSGEHSGAVGGAVLDVTEKIEGAVGGSNDTESGKPTLSEQIKANFGEFSRYIRKGIGHFGAFLILALCGTLAFMLSDIKRFPAVLLTLIYGLFVAVLTESLQLITPGRAGSIDDVLLDFFGYAVGAILVFLIAGIAFLVKKSKKKA